MSYIKESIIKEQEKIIGIKPVIDMKHFVELFLASLASESPIIYYDGRDTKTAVLRSDYKQKIQDIMYHENDDCEIIFFELIDIYTYYEYQLEWEEELVKTLKEYLKETNKSYTYDFEIDAITIDFTKEEIKTIKDKYDQQTLDSMSYFTLLFTNNNRKDEIQERDFKRNFTRYHQSLQEMNNKILYKNEITTQSIDEK